MKHFFTPCPAFSLLEAGIVLLIVGAVSASFLPLFFSMRELEQAKKTEQRLDSIQDALAEFFKSQGFYPCPSRTSLDQASFGQAQDSCTHDHEGILPFITLGLSPEAAKDGHHRWVTYAVDAQYTLPPEEASTNLLGAGLPRNAWGPFDTQATDGTLDITWVKPSGAKVPATGPTQKVAYLLISHGPGGDGAYSGVGSHRISNPQKSSALTGENGNGDTRYIFAAAQASPYFDHKVVWKTKSQGLE